MEAYSTYAPEGSVGDVNVGIQTMLGTYGKFHKPIEKSEEAEERIKEISNLIDEILEYHEEENKYSDLFYKKLEILKAKSTKPFDFGDVLFTCVKEYNDIKNSFEKGGNLADILKVKKSVRDINLKYTKAYKKELLRKQMFDDHKMANKNKNKMFQVTPVSKDYDEFISFLDDCMLELIS